MKQTINTASLRPGDLVIGYDHPVATLTQDGHALVITFTDGTAWYTWDIYTTTVMRAA